MTKYIDLENPKTAGQLMEQREIKLPNMFSDPYKVGSWLKSGGKYYKVIHLLHDLDEKEEVVFVTKHIADAIAPGVTTEGELVFANLTFDQQNSRIIAPDPGGLIN